MANLFSQFLIMGKKSSIDIIKTENNSKQIKKNTKTYSGVINPEIPFETLIKLYYDSFSVQGLTDKISTAINSWFQSENDELLKIIKQIDHAFLNRNKILCWNAFFEIITDLTWKIVELVPVLSSTILMMEDGDWYKQQVWVDTVYFNAFTPLDKREAKKKIWEESEAKDYELVNTGKGCGYNPNLNQIYHFKNTSLKSKYYWCSFFESGVNQLVLLWVIDSFYQKFFDDWLIKWKLIFSKDEKKRFSKEDKEILKTFVKWKMKWSKNSFSTAILDQEIWYIDLEHDFDTTAFLEYRKELLKSVAIGLNVPYDLLLSDNSNKSASQISMEAFNTFTIFPFQEQNLKDFKIIFADYPDIEDLEYNRINTKDEKEQMDILTWFKKSWIMTANEARERIGLPRIEDPEADRLTTQQWSDSDPNDVNISKLSEKEKDFFFNNLIDLIRKTNEDDTIKMINKSAKTFYDKLWDLEDDLFKNL